LAKDQTIKSPFSNLQSEICNPYTANLMPRFRSLEVNN
jgi:hypothetical protein